MHGAFSILATRTTGAREIAFFQPAPDWGQLIQAVPALFEQGSRELLLFWESPEGLLRVLGKVRRGSDRKLEFFPLESGEAHSPDENFRIAV